MWPGSVEVVQGQVQELHEGGVLRFGVGRDHSSAHQEVQGHGDGSELVLGGGDPGQELLSEVKRSNSEMLHTFTDY